MKHAPRIVLGLLVMLASCTHFDPITESTEPYRDEVVEMPLPEALEIVQTRLNGTLIPRASGGWTINVRVANSIDSGVYLAVRLDPVEGGTRVQMVPHWATWRGRADEVFGLLGR